MSINYVAEAPVTDASLRFLSGEGEMRKRIREYNWQDTALGDPVHWPPCLKTAVGIMLDSAGPTYIAATEHFIQLYNDAYIPILGKLKHPEALGNTTPETWNEIWDFVGPLFKEVIASCKPLSMENQLLPMLRNGYLEECYFSFTHSPLVDEAGKVIAVFVTVWETTREFVSNRRSNAIRALVQRLSGSDTLDDIYRAFERTVADFPEDLPFGMLYQLQPDQQVLKLVAAQGVEYETEISPAYLDPAQDGFYAGLINLHAPQGITHPVNSALIRSRHLAEHRAKPDKMEIVPLCYRQFNRADAYLFLGVNPMRPYDEDQKDFLESIRLHTENAFRRISKYQLEWVEREHQFHMILSALPCLVWIGNRANECVFVNQTWLTFRGRSFEQERGTGWMAGIHPDDLAMLRRSRKTLRRHASVTLEYRLLHADGKYRWVLNEIIPRYGTDKKFLGYIGTCVDITERKLIEQEVVASQKEMRMLYDRLQSAREEERRALSREVHDQLGQILSAAKIDIKLLEDDFRRADPHLSRKEVLSELSSASGTIEKSIQVVRRLATELRPPELEGQGLPAAIAWHARDFERRTKIACHLDLPGQMVLLSDAAAIALFRIFQEATTNILRHAKATEVSIMLRYRGNQALLRVLDNGVGISRARIHSMRSLGLTGMRERAAIAGGRLVVGPAWTKGTLVSAWVPIRSPENEGQAKGYARQVKGEVA